jgi:hypothetical protein
MIAFLKMLRLGPIAITPKLSPAFSSLLSQLVDDRLLAIM